MPAPSRSPNRTRIEVLNMALAKQSNASHGKELVLERVPPAAGTRGLPAGRSGLAAQVLHDRHGQDLGQGLEGRLTLLGAGRGGIAEVGVLAAGVGEGLGALLQRGH